VGAFQGLSGVALAGETAFACETGTGTVQVFRSGEYHYRIPIRGFASRPEALPEPRGIAPLEGGDFVVVCGGGGESAVLHIDVNGRLVRVLASEGLDEGRVHQPTGIAVEEGGPHPGTRVAVLDRDGDRVQVFTLSGRCYGSFVEAES
jgi:hypothetical protein